MFSYRQINGHKYKRENGYNGYHLDEVHGEHR